MEDTEVKILWDFNVEADETGHVIAHIIVLEKERRLHSLTWPFPVL